MLGVNLKQLLQDEEVLAEINRHKWIKSEKAGYDIGFEKAADDWLRHYGNDWKKNYDKKTKVLNSPAKVLRLGRRTVLKKKSDPSKSSRI